MNQTELAAGLTALNDKVTKIGTETTQLLKDIADLKVVIDSGPVKKELQDAFDKVAAKAQEVDDLVPDAPTPTT